MSLRLDRFYSPEWFLAPKNKLTCITNVLDISTKTVPLYSPSKANCNNRVYRARHFLLCLYYLTSVNSVEWFCPREKVGLHYKYIRYLHQTNIIVFTILSTFRQAKSHISTTIIKEVEKKKRRMNPTPVLES